MQFEANLPFSMKKGSTKHKKWKSSIFHRLSRFDEEAGEKRGSGGISTGNLLISTHEGISNILM
jgi:hypothetical protein